MGQRALLCMMTLLLAAGAAQAQTVDEVLAKYLEARGGREKILALQSVRLTGKMAMGPGMEAPMVMSWKRPMMLRMEFTLQGMTGIQAYDGSTGWMVMPFMGKNDPEKMAEEDLKSVTEQADFDGELVDWKQKGHTVELLGKEPMEGTPAWKLKVTRKNGDINFIYLDADAYLPIKEAGKRMMRGQEMEIETSIGDYKEVNGLILPHSLVSTIKSTEFTQTVTVEKYELGVALADTDFKMPEAKKPEAAPAVKPPAQR